MVSTLAMLQCGGAETDAGCNIGELDCACNQGQCLNGLACADGICVTEPSDSSDSTASSSTDEPTSTESSSTTEDTSSSETNEACDAPDMLCDGECINPLSDVDNCGECGKVCAAGIDSGGCSNGVCLPVWSSCIDASTLVLCPEVCQSQGFLGCSTAACGIENMSVWWFGSQVECDAGEFSTEAEANACEVEPNGMNDEYYRCCCEQN